MNDNWKPENRVFLCRTITLRKLLGVANNELENVPYMDMESYGCLLSVQFFSSS